MYADKITASMQTTIDETNRRRTKQIAYNEEHGITPTTVKKSKEEIYRQSSVLDVRAKDEQEDYYIEPDMPSVAADPILNQMSKEQLEKSIRQVERKMKKAAKDMDYMTAAQYRDEMLALQKQMKEWF